MKNFVFGKSKKVAICTALAAALLFLTNYSSTAAPQQNVRAGTSKQNRANSSSVLESQDHARQIFGGISVLNQNPDATCKVDQRGNILIVKKLKHFDLPPKPSSSYPPNKIATWSIGDYSFSDTTEYGGIIREPDFVPEANVYSVRGDGLIIERSGCTIGRGIISDVSGTALVILGSNNTISNIVIHNCGAIVRFEGSHNLVECSTYNGEGADTGTSAKVNTNQNQSQSAEMPDFTNTIVPNPSSIDVRGRVLQNSTTKNKRKP